MLYALLILLVLATSMLSGLLGMAGGMVLMAVLAATLPIATAMILHGAVQLTANGARAWFLRQHIRWSILPWYAAGAALVLALFSMLVLVPEAGWVLVCIGMLSLAGRFSGHVARMEVTRPAVASLCGAVVTAAQLLAGASGPLLDVFYLHSQMTRHEVVASKAITQAFGHVLKIGYYGVIIGSSATLPTPFLMLAMAAAVLGTRLGTTLLDRINERRFRHWSGLVITTLAGVCIVSGVWMIANR